MKDNSVVKKAFVDSVPVAAGYIVLGIGFGFILNTKGYGLPWAMAMSLFIYAGSMQFVCINLITSGASLAAAALTTLMVNARHLFYGISMIDRYRGTGKAKPYLIFALSDETYSLVCRDNIDVPKEKLTAYFFLVSLLDQAYWNIGTFIGSSAGYLLNINSDGMDFALTALFITIVTEQWLSSDRHRPAIIGGAVSVICLLVFGPSNFLIPAMIAITIGMFAIRKMEEGKDAGN